jgi:hypothetical protein
MTPSIPFRERHSCSVAEAVAYSGRGRTHLYDLMKAGEIRYVHNGRRRLILVRSLVDYFDNLDCAGVA